MRNSAVATLYSYFEESALKYPARPALRIGERVWAYRQLRASSDALSAAMQSARLSGENVGVLCRKSLSAYAGLLGIMGSGNTYVPLNPSFPVERLLAIAAEAELAAIIVDPSSLEKGTELLARRSRSMIVLLPEVAEVPAGLRRTGHHSIATAERLQPVSGGLGRAGGGAPEAAATAYLLFTSGSTGRPKGVPVTHANARACIEATHQQFPLHAADRLAQFGELGFDVSIAEIFLCWKAGGCLVAPSPRDLLMPLRFVNENSITVWSSVPTLANNLKILGLLKPGAMPSIRLTLFCGEALPSALARAWQGVAPTGRIVNLYGPTEATIFSTWYVFDAGAGEVGDIVPIGRPLEGLEVHIDPLAEAPTGAGEAIGELLLSGPQVVAGYWRNPEATANAFVRLAGDEGRPRIWYRTGDLVAHHPRLGLLFKGRRDHQIKLRGYRIELQEIESVLRRVTGADVVAVVPQGVRDGRAEELVAYCSSPLNEREAKLHCAKYLPPYMVPHRIVYRAVFPRNDNGKVDYVALQQQLPADLVPESMPLE